MSQYFLLHYYTARAVPSYSNISLFLPPKYTFYFITLKAVAPKTRCITNHKNSGFESQAALAFDHVLINFKHRFLGSLLVLRIVEHLPSVDSFT